MNEKFGTENQRIAVDENMSIKNETNDNDTSKRRPTLQISFAMYKKNVKTNSKGYHTRFHSCRGLVTDTGSKLSKCYAP
jgi:hypothetical protein